MWVDDFISLCADASAAMGIREATLSKRMLNDGKRLSAIRHGRDIGARRLQSAVSWMADNWPDGASRSPLLPPVSSPGVPTDTSSAGAPAGACDIAPAGGEASRMEAAE